MKKIIYILGAIILILLAILLYPTKKNVVIDPVVSNTNATSTSVAGLPKQSLPETCTDASEGTPVITSLSQYFGSVGTKIEIHGCNFSGFEGDLNAWIVNEKGEKGILYGQLGSNNKQINILLESPLCQKDMSYVGGECTTPLVLAPGMYKVYTNPWGKISNEVMFLVK